MLLDPPMVPLPAQKGLSQGSQQSVSKRHPPRCGTGKLSYVTRCCRCFSGSCAHRCIQTHGTETGFDVTVTPITTMGTIISIDQTFLPHSARMKRVAMGQHFNLTYQTQSPSIRLERQISFAYGEGFNAGRVTYARSVSGFCKRLLRGRD